MGRRRTKKNLLKKALRYGGSFGLLIASLIFCLHTIQSSANVAQDQSPLTQLSQVAAPELPARAVALVQAASDNAKISMITNTLWAVSGLARPGVMPYVISALCRANPTLADVVVGTAVEIDNTPIITIICAAKAGAPNMVEKMAVAAFRGNPAAMQDTALSFVNQTTLSSTNILNDLGEALPNLEPFVDMARIQADQAMIGQSSITDTNAEARQVSLVLGYTIYAITNTGQTLNEVLTNSISGMDDESPLNTTNNPTSSPAP